MAGRRDLRCDLATYDFFSTRKTLNKHFLTWTIENFCLFGGKPGDQLISPEFPASAPARHKWYVTVYPKGNERRNDEFIGCYLGLKGNAAEMYTKYSITFRNSQDEFIEANSVVRIFVKNDTYSWGWPRFSGRTKVLESLQDDILKVYVEIVTADDTVNQVDESYFPEELRAEKKLVDDLAKMFNNPQCSDVTILVEDQRIPAHQSILIARSTVFADMFGHDTLGRNTREVFIPDFDARTVNSMLRYMYTGGVPKLDIPLAMNLIRAARKYELSDLKETCGDFLISVMNIANASEILVAADLHNVFKLKQKAIEFISENLGALDLNGNRDILMQESQVLLDVLRKLPHVRILR